MACLRVGILFILRRCPVTLLTQGTFIAITLPLGSLCRVLKVCMLPIRQLLDSRTVLQQLTLNTWHRATLSVVRGRRIQQWMFPECPYRHILKLGAADSRTAVPRKPSWANEVPFPLTYLMCRRLKR